MHWWRLDTAALLYAFSGAPVDLVVISHLHYDHIVGLTQLVAAAKSVPAVWLPYVSPKERLLHVIQHGLMAAAGQIPRDFAAGVVRTMADPAGELRGMGVGMSASWAVTTIPRISTAPVSAPRAGRARCPGASRDVAPLRAPTREQCGRDRERVSRLHVDSDRGPSR